MSLLMLANAYRTLANLGRWTPLGVVPGRQRQPCADTICNDAFATRPHPAGDAAAAFIVDDILADRSARAGTFGLESWLATPYWAAAKTGTSKDMRDNWCIGFSRRHTVAVWVGNASGAAMHDVSGVSGAAPVWREIMDWLQANASGPTRHSTGRPFVPPSTLERSIHFEHSSEPDRNEYFLAGSEIPLVRPVGKGKLVKILYPNDGAVIALDPDIPPDKQVITLKFSTPPNKNWFWRVDDQSQNAVRIIHWTPQPGRHRLVIYDEQNREIDSTWFTVRALPFTNGRNRPGAR